MCSIKEFFLPLPRERLLLFRLLLFLLLFRLLLFLLLFRLLLLEGEGRGADTLREERSTMGLRPFLTVVVVRVVVVVR